MFPLYELSPKVVQQAAATSIIHSKYFAVSDWLKKTPTNSSQPEDVEDANNTPSIRWYITRVTLFSGK